MIIYKESTPWLALSFNDLEMKHFLEVKIEENYPTPPNWWLTWRFFFVSSGGWLTHIKLSIYAIRWHDWKVRLHKQVDLSYYHDWDLSCFFFILKISGYIYNMSCFSHANLPAVFQPQLPVATKPTTTVPCIASPVVVLLSPDALWVTAAFRAVHLPKPLRPFKRTSRRIRHRRFVWRFLVDFYFGWENTVGA